MYLDRNSRRGRWRIENLDSFRVAQWVVFLIISIVTVAGCILAITMYRESVREAVVSELQDHADLAVFEIESAYGPVADSLAILRDQIEEAAGALEPGDPAVRRLMLDRISPFHFVQGAALFNLAGDRVNGTIDVDRPINVLERGYFQYHLANPEERSVNVHLPLTSWLTGRRQFVFSAAVHGPDGALTGVVICGPWLDHLDSFAEISSDDDSGVVVIIYRDNHIVLAGGREEQRFPYERDGDLQILTMPPGEDYLYRVSDVQGFPLAAVAIQSLDRLAGHGEPIVSAAIAIGVALVVALLIYALIGEVVVQRLRLMASDAQAGLSARDEFMGVMSHELRTPLNGIIGFAEFLSLGDAKLDPKKRIEYYRDILYSGQQLRLMVDDLLCRIELDGHADYHCRDRVDFVTLVADAVEHLEHLVSKTDAEIEVVDHQTASFLGERRLLIEAIANLLANAIKFSEQVPVIEVSGQSVLRDGVRFIEITVKDRGIGFRQHDIDELTKPFRRERGSVNAEVVRGFGIGLSVVRSIAEIHDGRLTVAPREGGGSCVSISLRVRECDG